MIALRVVWQLRGLRRGGLLFALGCCFFAAAVLRITAVAGG